MLTSAPTCSPRSAFHIRWSLSFVTIMRTGTGTDTRQAYPATTFRLGARILSVVDCFDALTSDRPYRQRMSDEDSFAILQERSGNMYDPLVVDTFIDVFPEISPLAIQAGQQARSFMPTFKGATALDPLQQIRTNAEQTTLLGECTLSLRHSTSRREAIEVAAQFVSMLTPATVCAFFEYSAADDALTCTHSGGDTTVSLTGLSIKNGERTTGWATAHDTVMANSPATLDLMERASMFSPPLRTALVAPLKLDGQLLGALSAYTQAPVKRSLTITNTRWSESRQPLRKPCAISDHFHRHSDLRFVSRRHEDQPGRSTRVAGIID